MEAQTLDHRAGREGYVPIFIMGKRYEVPDTLTIQKAMEYAGYKLVRGCGCRGGICGACGTVYRYPGSYKIEIGLACQTVVKPDMHLALLPFFPANRSTYVVEQLTPGIESLVTNYPELLRCMQCNVCTKSCPMEIPTMEYMAAAMRGDVETLAKLSFDCIMCGLCTSRCPAEICQYNVAILGRRLYGRHVAPRAAHVAEMVARVESGRYEEGLRQLMAMEGPALKKVYTEREVEPQGSSDDWVPADKSNL
jgi:heterodisulfide reductase subunit C